MDNVRYDFDKVQSEGQAFIDKFRKHMKEIAEETIGELYCNVMPYLDSDTWTNYREALRIELEHEYKFSTFKNEWAVNFRRAVFVENRDEISKLIEQDILKRIKLLEDTIQEFEQFRYSPSGDSYREVLRDRDSYRAALVVAVEALEELKEHTASNLEDMQYFFENSCCPTRDEVAQCALADRFARKVLAEIRKLTGQETEIK